MCKSPEGMYFLPRQEGVKVAAVSGALAHSGLGEGGKGMECGVNLWRQRPA